MVRVLRGIEYRVVSPALYARTKPQIAVDYWYASVQGNCCEFVQKWRFRPSQIQRQRGQVTAWTRESRARLMRFINRIDWPSISNNLFLTVTYPDSIDHRDYSKRNHDRYIFLRYLEKALGRKFATLWRVEWMPRQTGERKGELMPHFHFLVFGVKYINWRIVREAWRKAIGYDAKHLVTYVQRVYGIDGAAKYLAKYCAKVASLDIAAYLNSGISFGRHWGITRKLLIPMCPVLVSRRLRDEEIEQIQADAAKRWPAYEPGLSGGFTLYGADAAAFWADSLNSP